MFKQKDEVKKKSGNASSGKEETKENKIETNNKPEEKIDEPETVVNDKPEEDKAAGKVKELESEVGELKDKLAKTESSLAKEKDDYVRLMADFENFRRHSSEERLALIGSAASDTIKGLLPTLDDCERALALLKDSSDKAAKEGTELIYNKLFAYLKSKGLEVVKAKGEKFDTNFHEAVTQFAVDDENKKGTVIDVIQTGYLLNGKVLRYAKVVVGA